ncbi:MAG: MgtC/SapB family protein [Ilumatobacteraceae bacterium]
MSDWEAIGLVALAALLGGILGFEREMKDKAAGIRTHLMVSTAAAAIVVLGRIVNEQSIADGQTGGDPARALHAVITGIGFIGAGAIMTRSSDHAPHGLTTAASLFFAAAVGVAVAFEEILIAVAMTAIALVALAGLPLLMRSIVRNR